MDRSITVESARPEERAAAFRLIFQYLPASECAARVATVLHLVDRGELDPAGILVTRRGDDVVGAMLCQSIPGASGLVWPPQTIRAARRHEWEDLLVQHAAAWLRRRGARLGQALMSPCESHLAASLERNGFAPITRLSYLRHPLDLMTPPMPVAGRLVYTPYDQGNPDRFHQTLLRTYEGTLDCPEVNGVRTLDEIMAGHRAQGAYDPERWWLALEAGRPAGVLLLTEMTEWPAWDVSYVGVVPEARGRGLGRELMTKALAEAHAAGVEVVTLSVDERNRPAWDLYLALGFEPYDQREVYLAVWGQPGIPE